MDESRDKERGPPPPGSGPLPAPPPFNFPDAGSSSVILGPPNQWPMYTHTPMHHPYNFHPPEQEHPTMENSHFVGVPSQTLFSTPPPPPHTKGNPSASRSSSAKVRASSKRKKDVIHVDDDVAPERTKQRLTYTPEEEKRLASAWLEHSNDPIDGNSKKSEKFWDDIAAEYNSTTEGNRKREAGQLKQHFQKVKAKLNAFHGEWSDVTKIYRSGFSEKQLQDMALKKYEVNKKASFPHLTMWLELRDHGKWLALVKKMNGEADQIDLTSNVIDVEGEERPMGRDKSKAKRDGKRKVREPEVVTVIGEKLEKLIEVQNASREERKKVIETQQHLSSQQLEAARLAKETKMIGLYEKLMFADTSGMDEDAKVERARALASMGATLFPQQN